MSSLLVQTRYLEARFVQRERLSVHNDRRLRQARPAGLIGHRKPELSRGDRPALPTINDDRVSRGSQRNMPLPFAELRLLQTPRRCSRAQSSLCSHPEKAISTDCGRIEDLDGRTGYDVPSWRSRGARALVHLQPNATVGPQLDYVERSSFDIASSPRVHSGCRPSADNGDITLVAIVKRISG